MPKAKPVKYGPQAKNDVATVMENGTVSINLLANDGGGKAKQLWSFDQADPTKNNTFVEFAGGSTVGVGGNGLPLYKTNDKFDYLGEGEIAYETFSYSIRLANGSYSVANVKVKVIGVNDPASLSSAFVKLVEGDSHEDISTNGRLKVSDVDGPDLFVAKTEEGVYGTFFIKENGSWSYIANSAHDEFVDTNTYGERFEVQSADGTWTFVAIEIMGTAEDAPLAGASMSGFEFL